MPVSGVVMAVAVLPRLGLDATRHAHPQAMAQAGPLFVGHHHEFELDLLHTRHRGGRPVDPLGELLGPGPRGHGQSHLDLHAAAARAHGSHQTELAQGQADLGLPDRAHCSLEL